MRAQRSKSRLALAAFDDDRPVVIVDESARDNAPQVAHMLVSNRRRRRFAVCRRGSDVSRRLS